MIDNILNSTGELNVIKKERNIYRASLTKINTYSILFSVFDNGVVRYDDNSEYQLCDPSFDIVKITKKKIVQKHKRMWALMAIALVSILSAIVYLIRMMYMLWSDDDHEPPFMIISGVCALSLAFLYYISLNDIRSEDYINGGRKNSRLRNLATAFLMVPYTMFVMVATPIIRVFKK